VLGLTGPVISRAVPRRRRRHYRTSAMGTATSSHGLESPPIAGSMSISRNPAGQSSDSSRCCSPSDVTRTISLITIPTNSDAQPEKGNAGEFITVMG